MMLAYGVPATMVPVALYIVFVAVELLVGAERAMMVLTNGMTTAMVAVALDVVFLTLALRAEGAVMMLAYGVPATMVPVALDILGLVVMVNFLFRLDLFGHVLALLRK
jgi:hypothetical protein